MSVYRTKALHKQFSESAHFRKFPVTQYEIFNCAQLLLFYVVIMCLHDYDTKAEAQGSKGICYRFTTHKIRITFKPKKYFVITVANFLES